MPGKLTVTIDAALVAREMNKAIERLGREMGVAAETASREFGYAMRQLAPYGGIDEAADYIRDTYSPMKPKQQIAKPESDDPVIMEQSSRAYRDLPDGD